MATRTSRKPASRSTPVSKSANYTRLLATIQSVSHEMVGRAASAVNRALVLRNWVVGAQIVEFEQGGSDRARYGARLLDQLADDLKARGLKGLDLRTLRDCRLLYLSYPQFRGTLSPEFASSPGQPIRGPLDPEFIGQHSARKIRGPADPESKRDGRTALEAPGPRRQLPQPLPVEAVLRLQWSHLLQFLRIDDPWKRAFYENQSLEGNWSKRQLQRQIESLLYERTGLSKKKTAVIRRAHEQAAGESVEDLIRDPYVLEFAGLAERAEYSESDLETALLDHLQRFLLELGTGFCFEARQFRITVSGKHNRIDLVFYHRQLRCHVLLDLKIRAFRHTDAGQMNFYVNWFKAHMAATGDNPPVGIILCSDRDHTEVEFATAGMDNRLFVSRYLTALPSAKQLKALVERDRARLEVPVPRKGKKAK